MIVVWILHEKKTAKSRLCPSTSGVLSFFFAYFCVFPSIFVSPISSRRSRSSWGISTSEFKVMYFPCMCCSNGFPFIHGGLVGSQLTCWNNHFIAISVNILVKNRLLLWHHYLLIFSCFSCFIIKGEMTKIQRLEGWSIPSESIKRI